MSNERLTGNVRFRTERRLFKDDVVVLQVEVVYGDGPSDSNGMPEYLAGQGWRDAQVRDLQFVPPIARHTHTPQP